MNTNQGVQHPAIDGLSAKSSVRFAQTLFFLVMLAALFAGGCVWDHSSPFADGDPYRGQLAISGVHSFLYTEPGTQAQIPQVRGFLRNLGHQTLIMVEITLSFKDRRNRVIFEETAYPVYVSSLSNPHGSKSLTPGQQIKFAFKSPACPKDWQPGQVEARVTKIVADNS
jgi:hypothetical protein